MSTTSQEVTKHADHAIWRKTVAPYERPDFKRSLWQVVNSVGPYLLLWWLMFESLAVSYWLTLALAIPAAGFLVRIFIIHHDCGHGSFFRSRPGNDFLGYLTGVLTFTPYQQWRRSHAIHHATSGDLDRRGIGDVWTMTVREYLAASPRDRLCYRLFRHPFVLFVLAPLYLFLVWHRFPASDMPPRERRSVHFTNFLLVALIALASLTIGWKAYVLIQLPIVWIGGTAAVWLFYVQHQFEETYWEEHENWEYLTASLQGSSFYKLPRVVQWFTGNIGFHHIHHLSPRIPNYFLERCHRDAEHLLVGEPLTFLASLESLRFRLWDEDRGRMVGYPG